MSNCTQPKFRSGRAMEIRTLIGGRGPCRKGGMGPRFQSEWLRSIASPKRNICSVVPVEPPMYGVQCACCAVKSHLDEPTN